MRDLILAHIYLLGLYFVGPGVTFRYVKNRCYSLVLSDQQLAEVAFQGHQDGASDVRGDSALRTKEK